MFQDHPFQIALTHNRMFMSPRFYAVCCHLSSWDEKRWLGRPEEVVNVGDSDDPKPYVLLWCDARPMATRSLSFSWNVSYQRPSRRSRKRFTIVAVPGSVPHVVIVLSSEPREKVGSASLPILSASNISREACFPFRVRQPLLLVHCRCILFRLYLT